MISLVPKWAMHIDAFWLEVKKRNEWFIKLRFGAVLLLIGFTVLCDVIFDFSMSKSQIIAIFSTTIFILLYNIILKYFSDKVKTDSNKFNLLHFSLLQMVIDLFSLALLIYFTGGVESPLYMLFIFHMIIGSMILPGKIVYSLASFIIIYFFTCSLLEYFAIIPHFTMQGLYGVPSFNNWKFLIIKNVFFAFIIILCVFIANHIAHQLYRLEQDLVDSIERLKEAEHEKQKYTMAVVHEIKTPLTAVTAMLGIIQSNILGPVSEQIANKIDRAMIRCTEAIDLINDVLRISRLRLLDEIKHETINLSELLSNIVEKYLPIAENKNIEIENLTSKNKSIKVLGDAFYIELIFSNIINNSIKYNKEGGQIVISIQAKDNHASVMVSDSGIGIPQTELDKIFKDFFRASNIKGKGIEGAGLGLSAVKQLIDKHNGTIKIQSPSIIAKDGAPGTTVEVTLPLSI